MKSKFNQEFQTFLFDPFKVFHFKVRKNNLQATTKIILNKGDYIFVMNFFKDDHEIKICDYTEHELDLLSKTYKDYIEQLVREPFKNSVLLFFLRLGSLKKSKTLTFFSRTIITSNQFSNKSEFSKFIATNINLNGNLINIINNTTLNEMYLLKYFHLLNVYLIEYTYLEKINFLTKLVIFFVRLLRLVIPMIPSIVGTSVLAVGIYNYNNLYNEGMIFLLSILLSVTLYYIIGRFSKRIFFKIFSQFF